eukprot:6462904-Amphidinium_carterae.1
MVGVHSDQELYFAWILCFFMKLLGLLFSECSFVAQASAEASKLHFTMSRYCLGKEQQRESNIAASFDSTVAVVTTRASEVAVMGCEDGMTSLYDGSPDLLVVEKVWQCAHTCLLSVISIGCLAPALLALLPRTMQERPNTPLERPTFVYYKASKKCIQRIGIFMQNTIVKKTITPAYTLISLLTVFWKEWNFISNTLTSNYHCTSYGFKQQASETTVRRKLCYNGCNYGKVDIRSFLLGYEVITAMKVGLRS